MSKIRRSMPPAHSASALRHEETINAAVLSAALAIAGGAVGVSGAGAGASTQNRIRTLVKAYIDGDDPTSPDADPADEGIVAGSITLSATDTSTIVANTQSATLAASFGIFAGAIAVGVSLAKNEISNEVDAFVDNADQLEATGTTGISITATDAATITSRAAAASAAATIGGLAISIAGAGADAFNAIYTKTRAYVEDSDVDSAGKVEVKATDVSTITAQVTAETLAIAGGVYAGALAIGAATARNYIGWSTDLGSTTASYTTDSNPASVVTGNTIRITSGGDAGSIYRYIGSGTLNRPTGANAVADGKWLRWLNFTDLGQWEQVNLVQRPAQVLAYVHDASVDADGAITVAAKETATITANIQATAISAAGGAIAVALSGAGVSIENRVQTDVKGYIDSTRGTGVDAGGGVSITANDLSTITATANAVSFALAIGIGGAGAVSISQAENSISNNVLGLCQQRQRRHHGRRPDDQGHRSGHHHHHGQCVVDRGGRGAQRRRQRARCRTRASPRRRRPTPTRWNSTSPATCRSTPSPPPLHRPRPPATPHRSGSSRFRPQ